MHRMMEKPNMFPDFYFVDKGDKRAKGKSALIYRIF